MSEPKYTYPDSEVWEKSGEGEQLSAIFDEVYSSHEDPWSSRATHAEKIRFKIQKDMIKNIRFNRALDIGCGNGIFVRVLKGLGADVFGTDISKTALRYAKREVNSDTAYVVSDARKLPFKEGQFDLACCLETLCYLNAQERIEGIKEMSRVLRKNGYVLVAGPVIGGKYFSYEELISLVSMEFKIVRMLPTRAVTFVSSRFLYRFFMILALLFPHRFADHIAILAKKV